MEIVNMITEEVAYAKGKLPAELPPLYHTVDPEALHRVLESLPDNEGSVKFTYADCQVTVDSDGAVTVKRMDIPPIKVD